MLQFHKLIIIMHLREGIDLKKVMTRNKSRNKNHVSITKYFSEI